MAVDRKTHWYRRGSSTPDDLRENEWAVAVHNDYRMNETKMTFWLLTRGRYCIKGEGLTDAEALDHCRTQAVSMDYEERLVEQTFASTPDGTRTIYTRQL